MPVHSGPPTYCYHGYRQCCAMKSSSATRHWRIMLEKVADFARKAVKLAEPYKPYGGQFLEFCSISLSTYQTCMKLTRKSTANFSAGIIRKGLPPPPPPTHTHTLTCALHHFVAQSRPVFRSRAAQCPAHTTGVTRLE